MNDLLELYGISTARANVDWLDVIHQEGCPYLNHRCYKTRKSTPSITIGTCSIRYGRDEKQIIICPYRLLERGQVFLDSLHLLTFHEPGNELHIVSEVAIPGGSVDYFLVSARDQKVIDFVGIELQTLDTTGTVWPTRQRFLQRQGVAATDDEIKHSKGFGMNWKMTAKTILVQLNHKIRTLENVNKHLVLVLQDYLLDYMQWAFRFDHLHDARLGDSMHLHSYKLKQTADQSYHLDLDSRLSTNADGVARSLGLQADPNLALEKILALLENKISEHTLFVLR